MIKSQSGSQVLEDLEKCLRWIHYELTDIDFANVLHDVVGGLMRQPPALRALLLPRVVREQGEVVAACYFKPLAGEVATLGKVRAAEARQAAAVQLLLRQAAELRQYGVPQIQAVVAEHDSATAQVVARAGLTSLTHVQHQWLDLTQVGAHPPEADPLSPPASLLWRPAASFARSRLARLIEETFQQTLDCPALNGIRDLSQVLDGFLDGRPLRCVDHLWEVLEHRGQVAGCLLLQAHAADVLELAYLGLVPAARGQRLGKQLIRRAIHRCSQRQSRALVAAVDEHNWPALNLYQQFGFQPQQRFEVWLYP